MEPLKKEVYEKIYPSLGCLFGSLGVLMSFLIGILILGTIDKASTDESIFKILIPIILFLACLAYFCFLKCFPRKYLCIYPTHITIHNRKFLWQDIDNITFQKEKGKKFYHIEFDIRNKRLRREIIILSLLLIIAISIGIIIFTTPDMPKENMFFLIIILPAMFGIDTFRPRRKVMQIDPVEDTQEVIRLTKHYAEKYNIPCHIPAEYEKDDKVISN